MKRVVNAELLDSLSPDDPLAIQSRRDLEKINFLMGNGRIMARALRQLLPSKERSFLHIADLGGGNCAFAAEVLTRLGPKVAGGVLTVVDRHPTAPKEVMEKCSRAGWKIELAPADVFEWLEAAKSGQADAIIANLFLHHFENFELGRLLQLSQGRTALFVAVEPRRSFLALQASGLVGLIGCCEVTRHDAVASVRAGFQDHELSRLWGGTTGWHLQEKPVALFSHLFLARKKVS
jgi:hypothetical protein